MLLPLLLGQGSGGGGGGPGPLTYADALFVDPIGAPGYTFTGLDIGAADADRWVIAALIVPHQGAASINTVTIGGVSATLLYEAPVLSAAGVEISFWKANVPTGTTANVYINASASFYWKASCATYHCIGEPILSDTAHDDTYTSAAFSVTVDVPEGGAVLAAAYNEDAGSLSSWAGVTADATDNAFRMYFASADELTAETGRTVSFTTTAASSSTGFYGLAVLSVEVPALAGGSGVTGTSSTTLDGVSQAATGVVPVSGSSAVTLGGVSQTASGQVALQGTSASTLDGVSQSGAGQVQVQGTSSATLDGVSQAGTGTVGTAAGVTGASAVTLDGVSQAADGRVAITGAASQQLAGVGQAATGQVQARGASVVTLDGVGQSGAGNVLIRGASAVVLDGVSQAGAGQVPVRGLSLVTLDGVTLSGTGTGPLPGVEGAGIAVLEGVTQAAQGVVTTPVSPPYDWAPAVELAGSSIIGQALRFMRLAPVARHDPTSDLLPALTEAFDSAIDELLSAADWSFASVLVHLPQAFPALTPEDDLPTLSALPGDLVQLREVRPSGARWRIDGATLRTDAPPPVTIRYTARITREDALPATFRTAVALRIAMLLGARWAGAAIEPEDLADEARRTLKQAMRDDTRHASSARAIPLPDLGYGTMDGDWAMEAVA